MHKINLIVLGLVFSLLLSCKKEERISKIANDNGQIYTNYLNEQKEIEKFTLFAGQHIDCGSLLVSNDEDFIYVKYKTNDNWHLKETHLYLGKKELMPSNKKGNPKVGNFPHNDVHQPIQEFEYKISKIDLDCFTIAAHASVELIESEEVVQQETAWAGTDTPVGGGGSDYDNMLDFGGKYVTTSNNGSWFTTVGYCNK